MENDRRGRYGRGEDGKDGCGMEKVRKKMWEEGFCKVRDFIASAQRPLILHISDTDTASYPFLHQLLSLVRPELTIHTGDMADEFKVGRIPAHIPGYRKAVKQMLDDCECFSDKIWITGGNNDDLSVLAGREKVKVWKNGARTEAFGVKFEINHVPIPSAWGVDFALYGHGGTDDLFYPPVKEEKTYLNGNFFWTLIEAKTKRIMRFPVREPWKCMRILIARHGQVLPEEYTDLPAYDYPITELGKRQARYLAKEVEKRNFKGKLISSPFTRALMTAQPLSWMIGCKIEVDARIREITFPHMTAFKGRTIEQMKEMFPQIAQQETLPYPWWTSKPETLEEVKNRVRLLVEECLLKGEDVMLVGHGATTFAAVQILMEKSGKELSGFWQMPEGGNCSLSEFRVVNGVVHPLSVFSVSHLPLEMVTSNQALALYGIK